MNVTELIKQLDDLRARTADEALSSPGGRDAFEYGRSVGVYKGLAMARAAVVDMMEERERVQRDL